MCVRAYPFASSILCWLHLHPTNAAEWELSVFPSESSSWLSPTLLHHNLHTLLPLGPLYPPFPTAWHVNTAALCHSSWLTLFSILGSLLRALLCRKTFITASAFENSISTMNISVYVCSCPQAARLYFQREHACGQSCNVCVIHSECTVQQRAPEEKRRATQPLFYCHNGRNQYDFSLFNGRQWYRHGSTRSLSAQPALIDPLLQGSLWDPQGVRTH